MEDKKSKQPLYAIIIIVVIAILIIGISFIKIKMNEKNDNNLTNVISDPEIETQIPNENIEAIEAGI